MADEYNIEAVVQFREEGASDAIGRVQRNLDKMRREGKITDEQFEQLTKTVTNTGKAAKGAGAQFDTVGKSLKVQSQDLPRLRYALYDVASTYRTVAIAAAGMVAATSAVAIAQESAFSAVERTTLDASGNVSANIGQIKDDLYDLAREIPRSFNELSQVASLGAQLGVADADLVKFTETVTKFAATTNISVDEAALAFGQIGNLLGVQAKDYDRLGSAIARVGVNSAATESQIVSIAREIAPAAAAAGFTADAVIGLSGALGSIKVPPERSRSTMLQFFEKLNMSVAKGGDDLKNFAAVVGVTTAELDSMVRNGQGEDILRRFLGTMSGADTTQITQALDALGLAGLRTNPTIRALSDNIGLLDQTMTDAKQGFAQGVFLDQAFAKVLEDAASQLIILSNAFQEFLAVAGEPALELIKQFVPQIVEMIKGFTDFAKSEPGKIFLTVGTAVTVATAVFFGYRAAINLATASVAALITAQEILSRRGVKNAGIAGLIAMMGGLKGATDGATASTLTLRSALGALGRATLVLGFLTLLYELLFNTREALLFMGPALIAAADFMRPLTSGVSDLAYAFANASSYQGAWLQGLGGMFAPIGQAISHFGTLARVVGAVFGMASGENANKSLNSLKGLNRKLVSSPRNLEKAAKGAIDFGGSLDDLGDSAAGAAKQIYTLVDYANDLQSVFSRSFDIRFKAGLQMDEVADSWDTLTDRINKARIELMGLTADRNIKEYFLSVADAYGDTLRGDKLRAEIAELNEQITEAQAEASTELNGNSKAARRNRKELTGIVSGYQEYIAALAESGADQETLNAAVAQAEAAFRSQAAGLGYSSAQITPYLTQLRSLTTVINSVPRNITVTANADAALQALNEFAARAAAAGSSAGSGFKNSFNSAAAGVGDDLGRQIDSALSSKTIKIQGGTGTLRFNSSGQLIEGNLGSMRFYSGGGYTGAGGKYEPAGIVHKGEYVVPKHQVDQRTGLPYASALGQMQTGTQAPRSSYAAGGHVTGNGLAVVDLSARAMKSLNRPVYVMLNGKVVAEAVYGNSEVQSLRGSN